MSELFVSFVTMFGGVFGAVLGLVAAIFTILVFLWIIGKILVRLDPPDKCLTNKKL